MMKTKSFQQIFDRISYKETIDKWEIVEPNSDATVKRLIINQCDSTFVAYTDTLFQGMSTLTSCRSTHLKDSDCDAFAYVFNDRFKKEQLLFTDLKSRFNIRKIKQAYSQMMFSLLKLIAMQSLCEGHSLDNQDIEMIVACKCFENLEQESLVKDEIIKGQEINDKFYNLLYTLINKNHAFITLNEFTPFKTIPLDEQIKNKEVKLTLIMTNQYNDDTVLYNKRN